MSKKRNLQRRIKAKAMKLLAKMTDEEREQVVAKIVKQNEHDWGKGYDVGQAGMLQAIKTAEQLATQRERERIIKLLEDNASGEYKKIMLTPRLISLIKDESKAIRSEILPNGTIYIEEIKGE